MKFVCKICGIQVREGDYPCEPKEMFEVGMEVEKCPLYQFPHHHRPKKDNNNGRD